MARTCQADDSLERHFEALLKQQAGSEVGLLIGKHAAGSKALLYGTIKTPSQEGLDPIAVSCGAVQSAVGGGGAVKTGKRPGAGGRAAPAAGAGAAVSLEAEWITEHARQVARLLPGGLSVLGLYVFCPEAAYLAAGPQLCDLLAGMAALCFPRHHLAPAAGGSGAGSGGSDPSADGPQQQQQLLLLHIDSTSRKQSLRALPLPAAAATASASVSSLRPVELKFVPTLLSGLVLLRCWLGVDLTLRVTDGGGAAGGGPSGKGWGGGVGPLRRQLEALVAEEMEHIRCGIFVAGGGPLLSDTAPIGEALAASAAASEPSPGGSAPLLHAPTFDLTLLAPPLCQNLHQQQHALDAEQPQSPHHQQQQRQQQQGGSGVAVRAVVGQARLRGCVRGLSFVGKREAVGRALSDLKADLLSSLSARLEILMEELERVSAHQQQQQSEEVERPGPGGAAAEDPPPHLLLSSPAQLVAAGSSGGAAVALPRRVLLPWLGGAVALCDYLLEGESPEAAADRAAELLALHQPHQQQQGQGASRGVGCQVLELELPPVLAAAEGPWQPNVLPGRGLPAAKAGDAGSGSSPISLLSSLSCSGTMFASLAVAAVASAVGMMLLMPPGGSREQ